ncbi:MAG TPA: PAS domain S-box protein, partial [Anaerolineales bacterium]|nr:PAS domain S-box protein [Anaerolineales bacterium]
MSAPFHVLFIEDNPGDARLVQEELRASGSKTPVQLEWVDRLEKGLERLGMNHIQAVLIDLHLPGSAGLESLECVLARAPHVPVIVMTGQTDEVLAMRAVQAGAQDYLVKGQVDGRLLMRSIQYAIQRKQTEMQLADALAYTERILTSSPVGILTYKLTGECMSANAYVAQMVGATVEQLLKQNFHQIESWRHSGLYALAQKAIAGKELAAADIHVMTSFGKDIWVRAQFVTFQSGGEERLLLTFGDITERKCAEEALRESEENYRQLFEAESDAIFLIENETGQILQANHAACVLYGYSRGELLAKRNTDLSAEPQQTRQVTTETPVLADQVINIPLRFHRKKDGTVFPVEITGRFFVHQGRAVHIAAIRDITERKQAEEALTASESRYRSLFESNPHPMWVYDLETLQFLAINDAAVEHYGYSQDEFLSMTIKEIRPVQDVPALMNNVAEDERILHLPAPWRHIKKDGSLIDVEITSHAVQWKDRPARLVLANDITERKRAEEKLRLSDQILQRVNALVLVADSDGNMTYISPSARTILGYEPDELLGANWWKASRAEPAAAQRERQYIRQAARREIQIPAEAYERPIQDRWGKTHWISWIDASGPNDTLIGLGHDITERKLAEERLIQSERDLAEAQRVAKIGSWRFDSRTNAVRWSEELYRIFGVQKAAFEENHKAFLEFVHPDDRSRVEQIDQQTLITGEPFHLEYNIVTPGGEQKTISEVGYPVTDSHDAIIGLFGTAQDITERKRAEEALLEAEAKYRTLVESIPAITYVAAVDANNTTLYISPQVTQILGFTPEELTDGSNLWTRQIHPDDRARVLSELQNSRASGKPFSAEYRIFTRDGSLVWAYDTADFVRDASNQPLFLQGVMLDITERKNLEAQLRQNEATLRGFYESAPSLMGITELVGEDDILHIYDNPATCRFFGAEKDATNGRLSSELGAPAGAIREWIEHYRESEGSGLPVHFEYLHQDGEHPRWLAVTVAVILEESSSRTRFCYVAEEITERKRAEEKIILQANLLGAVGSAAIATDLVGRVIYWNPAAERLYGWSTSEALGRLITELTPAEQSEE